MGSSPPGARRTASAGHLAPWGLVCGVEFATVGYLLIRRTLVYALVSAILVATYVAAVVLVGAALRPFIAGSDLSVAVSTLVVVALFQPARRRVQDLVDRRFYRSRYDAVGTIDAFAARLRDEVELDAVREDLLGAVGDTVRPAHASLWLR